MHPCPFSCKSLVGWIHDTERRTISTFRCMQFCKKNQSFLRLLVWAHYMPTVVLDGWKVTHENVGDLLELGKYDEFAMSIKKFQHRGANYELEERWITALIGCYIPWKKK